MLATNTLSETAAADGDTVALTLSPANAAWTATANAPWLHLLPASQSGKGSATVGFTFDDNQGGNRSGTLTIAGQTLAVQQAAAAFALGAAPLIEGAAAGGDSVFLTVDAAAATAP